MSGIYAGTPFADSKSSVASVLLAEVPFTKVADQSVWFSGDLTLTFTVDNTDGAGPLEGLIIKDTLDLTKFAYVPGSVVAMLGQAGTFTDLVLGIDYTVTYNTLAADGQLDISLLSTGAAASIPVGSKVVVSFRGTKVIA